MSVEVRSCVTHGLILPLWPVRSLIHGFQLRMAGVSLRRDFWVGAVMCNLVGRYLVPQFVGYVQGSLFFYILCGSSLFLQFRRTYPGTPYYNL